jgi:putative N6-adenine-specific DNA methylase
MTVNEPMYALPTWTPSGGRLIAKTMQGLEAVLAEELRQMGAENVEEHRRAVAFDGDRKMLYRVNYEARTALRVLTPIYSFTALQEKQFYNKVREVDWSKYMHVDQTLAVDAIVQSATFGHSKYLALLTKDAIVDQFREKQGKRPSVNTEAPHIKIHVHVYGNHCDIMLDSSGDSLHLRGYRRDVVSAPLNEVLAAGMILLSGWNGRGAFADPMCGSGTLPIEAAMIAMRIPPQRQRNNFSFMRWNSFDGKLWEQVRKEAESNITPFEFPILASDIDSRARNAAAINVMTAELENVIQIERKPFAALEPPAEHGFIITNPPYDERMPLEDAIAFYQKIGDRLKHRWTGWEAWIISANKEALKHLGLRPSRKIPLLNGALECSYQRFELFAGKKGYTAEQEAS